MEVAARGVAAVVLVFLAVGCRLERPLRGTAPLPRLEMPPARAAFLRADALARARIRGQPPVPISQADFLANPPGPDSFPPTAELTCRFELRPSEGRTPKFQCRLPSGESIKVKYGRTNVETRTEVAASRLLGALGYGADHMYVVRQVHCYGCPRYPYPRLSWFDSLFVDYSRAYDFDFAVVERPFEGERIETAEVKGWAWYELDRLDPARGAASREERDAFRLLAAFLNHWDNKPENQRLVCLPGGAEAEGACRLPFLMIQDLGADLGPWSMDLQGWSTHGVWADRATCRLSMKLLPFQGGTFPDVQVSEGGRRLLADLLGQLSPGQVRDLFVGARFTEPRVGPPGTGDVAGWARVFEDRVRQIAEGPPCPPVATSSGP